MLFRRVVSSSDISFHLEIQLVDHYYQREAKTDSEDADGDYYL